MENVFLAKLEEIFDMTEGRLSVEAKLPEDLWDSLTILSVSAAIDSVYDKVIPVKKIEKCSTVQELLDLIKEA